MVIVLDTLGPWGYFDTVPGQSHNSAAWWRASGIDAIRCARNNTWLFFVRFFCLTVKTEYFQHARNTVIASSKRIF